MFGESKEKKEDNGNSKSEPSKSKGRREEDANFRRIVRGQAETDKAHSGSEGGDGKRK